MISAHVTTPKLIGSWIALLVLTFLSFGISRLGLGEAELVIALAISVAKTFVVLFIFMHLVEQRFANRLIVILTFLFIALLVALTAADPLTRKTFPPRPDPAAHPYP
ncbi:cytochrome C oxidase subunit IV family protein [Polyangium jinanense]|uniref:Cytochrome C oxidase subunit IV family protein n=1 Tax=Polyangium jinanense TaxID=2829994 RepID=A0A9X4AQF0_9BACT|nr:cytochrome C oxidase subunit IV family protein [Polyangium jinanense]MDC3953936.1 cytochrome C oxidase subunit IV family protein [Polyangium jinanense]MDC3957851.1 cytochrome C oxidase subunit IV family protein [Polyangium jinanense]MDC3978937.1 cytochrome C oxidase subunit IV family protein [Polyangium jinanense]MDC3982108.1 cytochrome C oxidase subunit IV family protein [Polyangium jinanense]